MITEPVTDENHLEILEAVEDFASSTYSVERSRQGARSEAAAAGWSQLGELGWTALGVPEEAGGEGLGLVALAIVHRALAARLAPSPFLATGFAATALAELAEPEVAVELLGPLAAGARRGALVVGADGSWLAAHGAIRVRHDGGDAVLDGEAAMVPDGADAELLVVLAGEADGGVGLYAVDPAVAGLHRERVVAVDVTRDFGGLSFAGVTARRLAAAPIAPERLDALADRLAVPVAAEMIGAARASFDLTLGYLKTREQFGRPIGSFQALKHRCADLAVQLTVAQELVFEAAEAADRGDGRALGLAAPLALHRASTTALRIGSEAIQLHGGSGFADEVDAGLFYKRAVVDAEILAAPADCAARVAWQRRAGKGQE